MIVRSLNRIIRNPGFNPPAMAPTGFRIDPPLDQPRPTREIKRLPDSGGVVLNGIMVIQGLHPMFRFGNLGTAKKGVERSSDIGKGLLAMLDAGYIAPG